MYRWWRWYQCCWRWGCANSGPAFFSNIFFHAYPLLLLSRRFKHNGRCYCHICTLRVTFLYLLWRLLYCSLDPSHSLTWCSPTVQIHLNQQQRRQRKLPQNDQAAEKLVTHERTFERARLAAGVQEGRANSSESNQPRVAGRCDNKGIRVSSC